jgi:hypothetical protein
LLEGERQAGYTECRRLNYYFRRGNELKIKFFSAFPIKAVFYFFLIKKYECAIDDKNRKPIAMEYEYEKTPVS